jgi:hypothetical protein
MQKKIEADSSLTSHPTIKRDMQQTYDDVFEITPVSGASISKVNQTTPYFFRNKLVDKPAKHISRRALADKLSRLLYPEEAKRNTGKYFIYQPQPPPKHFTTVLVKQWKKHMGIYRLIDLLAYGKARNYHNLKLNPFLIQTQKKAALFGREKWLFVESVKLFAEKWRTDKNVDIEDVKFYTFNDIPVVKQYIARHVEGQHKPSKPKAKTLEALTAMVQQNNAILLDMMERIKRLEQQQTVSAVESESE